MLYVFIYFVEDVPSLDAAIKEANIQLEKENQQIQALNTSLHEKYHSMSLKVSMQISDYYFPFYRYKWNSKEQAFRTKYYGERCMK